MAENVCRSENLWISPLTAYSVKVFQATIGKFPSPNFNLRLVSNLPFLELNPILLRQDVLNKIAVPMLGFYTITLFLLVNKTEAHTAIQIEQIMVLIIAMNLLLFGSLVRHACQQYSYGVHQANYFFQSNPTQRLQKTKTNCKPAKLIFNDFTGMLMLSIVLQHNILGIPSGTLLCYTGVDPLQATFEQVFNLKSNIITFIISSFFTTIWLVFICMRELFIMTFLGVILFVRINAELVALHSYPLSFSAFVCDRYIVLRRQYLRIAEAFSQITGYAVVFVQVLVCTFLWMVLICWKLIPSLLTAGFLGGAMISLGGVIFLLKTQSTCRAASENLLTKHLDGFHVYGIRGGASGYWKRMWKWQIPLRIYCGKQFIIGHDAIMNYLDVLTSNLTNVLVLIKI